MAEGRWWKLRVDDDNDHAKDAYDLFEAYRAVPDFLGHVLEIGCGPFTQLRTILGSPDHTYEVSSVTLVDPILIHESKHPKSSYGSGQFEAHGTLYHTKLHQVGAEDVGRMYHEHFDTVIMQNVLEHVVDAYAVLESMYNATKVGGVVVLWEPTYSAQWSGWVDAGIHELVYDVNWPAVFDDIAHPIRADPSVLRHFASFFDPIMWKETPGRRGDMSAMLVGRKKRLSTEL